MLSFGLLAATVAAFIWGRLRYDLIALLSLVIGLLSGVVPTKLAFDGFKNDVVVIIATALVVSAAFARSGVVEALLRPLLGRLKSERGLAPVLTVATALVSMTTKNVGALAMLMPVAMQAARRTGASPSRLLMPMSFASLVGGLVTLVGTSTNIIVSQVREQTVGKPFGMYDFAGVGLSLTAVCLVYLVFAYRLLPKGRQGEAGIETALEAKSYVTEARAPADWTTRRVADLVADAPKGARVAALVRGGQRRIKPHANTQVKAGDLVVLEGEQETLHRLIESAKLKTVHPEHEAETAPREEMRSIEGVVGADSPLVGRNAKRLKLAADFGVKLVAVAPAGRRVAEPIGGASLRSGDVVILRGGETVLPAALTGLKVLPLAEREVRLGGPTSRWIAPAILAVAMVLVAFNVVPVAIAFLAAATAMVATRAIPMREAYSSLDAPVLVLIAALIPISEAIQANGGADLIASSLAAAFHLLPPLAIVAALMLAAMACAPFMHNAPTVLILAPVAVGVAHRLHLSPDPLLMAVATGAGCDFLTPIGHQCNTLVMAPGGYRFTDYPRLGTPLSVLVIGLGAPIIAFFWPLGG
jgi:di/tricarboxylate transporter